MSHTEQVNRFSGRLVSLCPEEFVSIVEKAARKRIMNRSAYIREAVIERLRADGIEFGCERDAGGHDA